MSGGFVVEPVDDKEWLRRFVAEQWGEPGVVSRGRLWTGDTLEAVAAKRDGETIGVVSWREDGERWELTTVNALVEGKGVATALIEAVAGLARGAGIDRVWLITTNDNTDALRFYQRRGFRLKALHAGAIAESRRLKPAIPEFGEHGIPIRDEIELELLLRST